MKELMEGIIKGIPKKSHKPVADGIVLGLAKKDNLSLSPDLHKTTPSATKMSIGVFGAGATPQGEGDGAGSGKMYKGMRLAH